MTPNNCTFFGPPGVGKSTTALLLAIGLSKELFNSAPITFVDPEEVERFIRPICDAEEIPLLVERSRSFVDMQAALAVALERQSCVFLVDHYDGIYRELSEAQKIALNLQGRQRPYHHREELMRIWDQWVLLYRSSPINCLFTARQAWDWGDDEDAEGEPFKVKLGGKARGDADANYEPNLLIEMERIDRFTREKQTRRKKGVIQHVCRVVKDRNMTLNGLSFTFEDTNGYKPGGYKAVWKALGTHFIPRQPSAHLGGVLRPEGTPRASTSLFTKHESESSYAERANRIKIAIEEMHGSLRAIWPGDTNDEKRLRAIVMETLFHTRSWMKVETLLPEVLESAVSILQLFEGDNSNKRDEASVIDGIQAAKDAIKADRAEKAMAF